MEVPVTTQHPPVDLERLRRDIERNAQFGVVPTEKGVARTVLPGTEENREARKNLVDSMIHANMDVKFDAVGNIVGTWNPPQCDPTAAPVAIGSHLDSVPNGGIFDGPLGIFAGLEAVRAIQEAAVSLYRPIQVVCFTGEEGTRFADGVLGSSVASGLLGVEDALSLSDGTETLREALDAIGFHGEGRVDATDWHAFLELHIEQGTRLERMGLQAGVVTTISGTTRIHSTIEGESNHSGTTPMSDRTDALAAASEFVLSVEKSVREFDSKTAVATVGELSVDPNAVNVVPGEVEVSADIRDVDEAVIQTLVDDARTTLQQLENDRGVTTTFESSYEVSPIDMAPACRDALHSSGEQLGIEMVDMHSGAGHDSMQIAQATDVGLLFVPSQGGHSHNALEWTDWGVCANATELLTVALSSLAGSRDDSVEWLSI